MTFCRRIGWYVYGLAVVALSCGIWWFVSDCLEVKPVWTIPIEDTLQLTHYQPGEKLLAGYRGKSADQLELVVLDSANGHEKATLTVPTHAVPKDGAAQPIDIGPRLYGDTVVRFTSRTLETGENQVEFRSWKYTSEARETILASWRMPSAPVKYNVTLNGTTNYQQEWIKTVWSVDNEGLALVYRYLPTDQLLNHLFRGFNLDLNLGWIEYTRLCYLSFWLCEAWQWDQEAGQFRKVNQYTTTMIDRAPFDGVLNNQPRPPRQDTWTSNGRSFYLPIQWNEKFSGVKQVDAITGIVTPSILFDGSKQHYRVNTAGNLLLPRRYQTIDRQEAGKLQHQWVESPHKDSKIVWSINEWRPLLDANTLKRIEWPAELDHRIVGEDQLMVDGADPTRYLYHTNVCDQSPYWQPKPFGSMKSHFVFMRYQEGKLDIEHQWRYDGNGQWRTSALCGQLFVEGQQDLELSEPLQQMLMMVRPLWLLYFERAKINAPYVAEVAIEDGTMRWKKLERELAPIPFLDKDYLLLRCRTVYMSQQAGYECWKLPIEVSSAWWGRLSGLTVFTVLVLCSVFAIRPHKLTKVTSIQ